MKTPMTLGLFLLVFLQLHAQDPFYIHFFNNKSGFNPALTGMSGALVVLDLPWVGIFAVALYLINPAFQIGRA